MVPPVTHRPRPVSSPTQATTRAADHTSGSIPIKKAAPKPPVATVATADRLERASTASSPERATVRDAARPQRALPARTLEETPKGMSPTERARVIKDAPPSVQRAADARATADAAERRVAQAQGQRVATGVRDSVPFVRDATPAQRAQNNTAVRDSGIEAAQARRAAAAAERTAIGDIKAPADKAITESRAAQSAAAQANAAAAAADQRVTALQAQVKPGNTPLAAESREAVSVAKSAAMQAHTAADAANATALEKGDAAIKAQQTANHRAEAIGQSPPYPAAAGVKNTADAAGRSVEDQKKLLGGPAGLSPQQALTQTSTAATRTAEGSISASGDAQRAAQAAKANLAAAEANVALAQQQVAALNTSQVPAAARLGAQEALNQAKAEQAKAQADYNRADRTARDAGDKAIGAQKDANAAATAAGRPEPYPQANGIRNTADAASLTPAEQKKLLGGTSTISQQDAIAEDMKRITTAGSPAERAAGLEEVMNQNTSAAYKDAFIAAAGPAVQAIAKDAISDTGPGSDQRAGEVMDTMARAMDAAGGAQSDALQKQWQKGVDKVVMGPQAAVDLANRPEDTAGSRNRDITQGYHDFSEQTALTLGRDNANWTTYGQWASAGAGEVIRGNLPGNKAERAGAFVIGVDTDQAIRATAEGNATIFRDVGPQLASYNRAILGDPRWRTDPERMPALVDKAAADAERVTGQKTSPQMSEALHAYGDAAVLNSRQPLNAAQQQELAQTIYRGNVRIAEHEQTIADKAVDSAIQDTVGGDIAGMLFPKTGSASEEATERIQIGFGSGMMHVSDDVTGKVPDQLQHVDDAKLNQDIQGWNNGKPYEDRSYSDASNWRDFGERMGYISHVFAANQQNGESIFGGPPSLA